MRADPGAATIWSFQPARARASDFLELTKPRVTFLVLFTTFVGFCCGTDGAIPFFLLCHTLAGTALVAAGAGAFNMYAERELDARMGRTALRPLAAGRMRSGPALSFAIVVSTGGFFYLFFLVNGTTAWLSAIIFFGYLFLYTPLKSKTWLCTLVGAIPGALPIVLGWTGANPVLSFRAWVLFDIVFLWQLPHFYAIGWMYRDEYARAGLPVLSVIDYSGRRTGRQAVACISLLIIATLLPSCLGMAGLPYAFGAILLGASFLAFGLHFARWRDRISAHRLFVASALYLPALLIFLLWNKCAA
jgi:heme o synthase